MIQSNCILEPIRFYGTLTEIQCVVVIYSFFFCTASFFLNFSVIFRISHRREIKNWFGHGEFEWKKESIRLISGYKSNRMQIIQLDLNGWMVEYSKFHASTVSWTTSPKWLDKTKAKRGQLKLTDRILVPILITIKMRILWNCMRLLNITNDSLKILIWM